MEKIKPEVDHYIQVEFMGEPCRGECPLSHAAMELAAIADIEAFGVKAKFRPVYKKEVK